MWRQHFGTLATPEYHPDFDKEYGRHAASEILDIMDICSSVQVKDSEDNISEQQVKEAIESMTMGKAVGFHSVTVEHFLCPALLQIVTEIINSAFRFGRVTEALSIGSLTPIFKIKGSSIDAKNYRGITILPTITKIIETLIKGLIQP